MLRRAVRRRDRLDVARSVSRALDGWARRARRRRRRRTSASGTSARAMSIRCAPSLRNATCDSKRSRTSKRAASASRARAFARSIAQGDLALADHLLGHSYELRGDDRGRLRPRARSRISRRPTCARRKNCYPRTASIRPSRATTAATTRRWSRSAPIRSSTGSFGRSRPGCATFTKRSTVTSSRCATCATSANSGSSPRRRTHRANAI